MEGTATAEVRRVAHGRWAYRIVRLGLLAQGFSYVLVGALAVELAVGLGGETTSRQGALATLADETGGVILLAVVAFGFLGYAIWRLAQSIFDRGGDGDDAKGLAKRAGQLGKAAIYLGLTWATVALIVDGSPRATARRRTVRPPASSTGRRGAGSSPGSASPSSRLPRTSSTVRSAASSWRRWRTTS